MKARLIEHVLSIVLITAILIAALFIVRSGAKIENAKEKSKLSAYGDLSFVDFNDPFHKMLLKDVMNIYYPDQYDTNTAIISRILSNKEKEFSNNLQKSFIEEKLSAAKLWQLSGMYLKFIIVYIIVMALTFYGVQTLAVFQFVRKKQKRFIGKLTPIKKLGRVFTTIAKLIAYFALFSPAYVIAYSIRTEFNTDTIVFMALLGVISNGLLITYTNKFYAFLVAESRKGYVDTAIVKNLYNSYMFHGVNGIPLRTILRPFKRFDGHVFNHIFVNAKHQYLATIKEQASFLITGLIIIEMALNIHGHLSYEMLRQLMYKNYDIVIVIVLGIFYTVKATEIVVDYLEHRENMKYENKEVQLAIADGENHAA